MTTWKTGRRVLRLRLREKTLSTKKFLSELSTFSPHRVPGTAVFMTGDESGIPASLVHNLRHNQVLHQKVVLLTVVTENRPKVSLSNRLVLRELGQGLYRLILHVGFMEFTDIPQIIEAARKQGLDAGEFSKITFFLGRETVLATKRPGMSLWREKLFSLMSRNAERATAYFNIPPEQVMEIGAQIEM
jgi:KUP system potassium uptake protein